MSPTSTHWADLRHWLIQLGVYEEEIEAGEFVLGEVVVESVSSVVEKMYGVVSGLT